ncbi:MAG: carbohydrate ABC transporter permease [Puniceicoccaceae bacterium]|nr:MAG: carbohydrate ABC transporter permease [Puniceicoccaceae bacterium]
MSPLHFTLGLLALIFIGLFLVNPRQPRLALTYLRYVLLCLAAATILTPFVWLITASFKSPDVLMQYVFLPPLPDINFDTINLGNFRRLFEPEPTPQGQVYFWQYIFNSLFLASATTVIQLFFCSMGGYALAKYNFPGKTALMLFMLGSLMIPGMILLAPLYEMIVRIGFVDTYWALLLPGAVTAFGMFLFRQAIIVVPDELIEAGRIDGCSEFSIYLRLVMPLVRPMSGAFCLITFLASWNNFLGPQIFIHTQAKLTLPVVLTQYVGVYTQQYGVFLAGTLLAIIPPAILFFALQREFISGLTSGAVKG